MIFKNQIRRGAGILNRGERCLFRTVADAIMLKIIIGALIVFDIVLAYSCCKVSSECSRIEEEIHGEISKRER